MLDSLPFKIGTFMLAIGFLIWLLYRGMPGLYEMAVGGHSIYAKALKFVALPAFILLMAFLILQLRDASRELWYLIKKQFADEEKARPPSDISPANKDEEID